MQLSSSNLLWPHLVLEKHIAPPGDRPETTIDCFLLCLWQGRTAARGEHANSRKSFVPRVIQPGTMTSYSPGAVAAVRPYNSSNFLLCALDRKFLQEVEDEMKDESGISAYPADRAISWDQPAFDDPSLRQILLLLQQEAKSGGQSGSLYVDGLTQALAVRFLSLTHPPSNKQLPSATLPSAVLRRLVERIEEDPLGRFDLETLAAEIGYSKRHLLRTFRASTGFSPHQYVMHHRLERARQLMRRRSFTLLDIALESGFASHAHLSRAFRQRYGIAPSDFRRAL